MDNILKIESVMHSCPHTVGLDQTLEVAKEMMREHGIRHLPVCQGGELRGILSDRDIEFALRVEKLSPTELLVKSCCTLEPYKVETGTSVADVARKMAAERIGCALVVERGRVVGIFTTVDACRVLADTLSDHRD